MDAELEVGAAALSSVTLCVSVCVWCGGGMQQQHRGSDTLPSVTSTADSFRGGSPARHGTTCHHCLSLRQR